MTIERKDSDAIIEWWMIEMGLVDREQYRELRKLAWAFVTERSACSDKTKKMS